MVDIDDERALAQVDQGVGGEGAIVAATRGGDGIGALLRGQVGDDILDADAKAGACRLDDGLRGIEGAAEGGEQGAVLFRLGGKVSLERALRPEGGAACKKLEVGRGAGQSVEREAAIGRQDVAAGQFGIAAQEGFQAIAVEPGGARIGRAIEGEAAVPVGNMGIGRQVDEADAFDGIAVERRLDVGSCIERRQVALGLAQCLQAVGLEAQVVGRKGSADQG